MVPTINYCSNCVYFENRENCILCTQLTAISEPTNYYPKILKLKGQCLNKEKYKEIINLVGD